MAEQTVTSIKPLPRQDTVEQARKGMEDRKAALVAFREQVEAILAPIRAEEAEIDNALVGMNGTPEPEPEAETEVESPAKRRGRPRGKAKRGSRKGQLLDYFRKHPGHTIKQAAEEFGIEPNYLYRVRDKLVTEKALVVDSDHGHTVKS